MSRLAILVGNVNYLANPRLECCEADVSAIHELLIATEKFDDIVTIKDKESDDLKLKLRAAFDKFHAPTEVFLYFTGHGHIHESEFYYCATNFDARQPNKTGLSITELHALLRPLDAALIVNVIDACYSGIALVKNEPAWIPQNKDAFRNLIQISSSLNTQTSRTGHPLSHFTQRFRDAVLQKQAGPVFYTDIISALRDAYIENDAQTPHFVSQGTGREQFVDDALRFEALRKALAQNQGIEAAEAEVAAVKPSSLLERLEAADSKVVTPSRMSDFVGSFFDKLQANLSESEFFEFFDFDTVEHSDFDEKNAEKFIIQVLQSEQRADNFVTARYSRTLKKTNPLLGGALQQLYLGDDAYQEDWHLRLNCSMKRAQIKMTLTPKFTNLQRIVLIVTCAPSLDNCHIFEITTQHKLQDFGKYDQGGRELSRRFWKLAWGQSTDGVVAEIAAKFEESTQAQLESAERRLSRDEDG